MSRKVLTTILLPVAILTLLSMAAIAQDTSTTSVTQDAGSTSFQVERGEVVYVSGNEVVVKMENGDIRAVTVPPHATAVVDGKQITVSDLKPGMKLERTIATTTTPEYVTTVRTISGKVWHVSPPSTVILSLPEGNKQYKVPKGQIFKIEGQDKTVFDLKKGMMVSATVVTRVPQTVIASQKSVTGSAPPPPETPPMEGALLIEDKAPTQVATAAPAPALPQTGSPVPLIGMMGVGMLLAGLGLTRFRTK